MTGPATPGMCCANSKHIATCPTSMATRAGRGSKLHLGFSHALRAVLLCICVLTGCEDQRQHSNSNPCCYVSHIMHTQDDGGVQGEQKGFWHTLWAMLLDIYVVLTGPERRAVRIALWLAFFDQGCASTAIINYAPEVLEIAGVTDYGDATLWSSAITASKVCCGTTRSHCSSCITGQNQISTNMHSARCCSLKSDTWSCNGACQLSFNADMVTLACGYMRVF